MWRELEYELEDEAELRRMLRQEDAAFTHGLRRRGRESFTQRFSNYDVIDSRIDVAAQRALIRLRNNPATSARATAMLAAVKRGQLSGIYGDDLRAAAQLAARLNTVRWELVPRGRDAATVREHNPSAAPTIIFRANIRSDRLRLDRALLTAWAGFRNNSVIAIRHPQFGFVWSEPSVSTARRATRFFDTSLHTRAPSQVSRRAWPTALGSQGEAQVLPSLTEPLLIQDTMRAPLRWICSLIINFGEDPDDSTPARPNRLGALGTGLLISPIHVLTAGHNITNFDLTGSAGTPLPRTTAKDIFVIPGRNSASSNKAPFGLFLVDEPRRMRVSEGWHKFRGRRFDFGLITLKNPVGNAGFWGSKGAGQNVQAVIRPTQPGALDNLDVVTSGYRADKCGTQPPIGSASDGVLIRCRNEDRSQDPTVQNHASTQWVSRGLSNFNNTEQLLDITGLNGRAGQSGSPIWTGPETSPKLLAILATIKVESGVQPNATNQAVPITKQLLAQLSRWMREDGVQPSFK